MLVKEIAQGSAQAMSDGAAERDVIVVLADGQELNIRKMVLVRGDKVLEPSDQASDPAVVLKLYL